MTKQVPATVDKIEGLGQHELSLGYYQWSINTHYKEGIKKGEYTLTPYDALSLCYLGLRNDKDRLALGIKWYEGLVEKHPGNYALLIGYANILNNRGIYEEAILYYEKVVKLRPDWMRPRECLAMIYELNRVNKVRAKDTANQILKVDGENRIALFVVARNEENI